MKRCRSRIVSMIVALFLFPLRTCSIALADQPRDKNDQKVVTIIWESNVKKEFVDKGLAINRKIWDDMTRFEGYIDHKILIDADSPGHFVIVSHWTNRDMADRSLQIYKTSPNVSEISTILEAPRKRYVLYEDK